MGKNLAGWRRASVFNPDDGTVVQLNRMSPDLSAWEKSPILTETTQGQLFGGYSILMELGFLESDGLSQLTTWENDDVEVRAVVDGVGGSVLFEVPKELDFERGVGVNARDGVMVHVARLASEGGTPDIDEATNIASLSRYFSGDSDEFYFPVEGATVQAGADYSGVTSTNLVITAYDYGTDGTDGSSLGSSSTSVGSDGRFTASLTLPANTYRVEVDFNSASDGGATISDKTVRTDGKNAYVSY